MGMSLIKKFAGQAVIYGISSILSRVVYTLIVTFLLAWLLGRKTDEFGTFAIFYAYAAVLITLFSFRLDTALFRYGSKDQDLGRAFDTAIIPVVFSAIGLAAMGWFFAQPIAELIGFSQESRYVRWFAFILAFDVLNLLPFAKLRLTDRAITFAKYKVANVTISSLLVLFFFFIVPKYADGFLSFIPQLPSLVDWVFIANLIASAILFLTLLPVWKPFRLRVDRVLLGKMLYYVFPLVIVGVANGVIQFFATPLQEMFLTGDHESNLAEAGVYEFTRRVASLFVMFTTAFNYAAEPFFFNNSTEENRTKLYGKICRLFTLIGGLVIVAMVLGQDLIRLISRSDYWESMSLLPVLLLAYLLLGIYYNISIWYKLSDKTWYGALLSILGLIVTLGISIYYLPRIGYAASAWSALVSYGLMVVCGYLIGQSKYPIPYPVKKICTNLIVIITIFIVAHYLRLYAPVTVRYTFCVIMLGIYLWYMWLAEREEWMVLLGRKA